jgi:tRNA threonylcarbamoyladenosine biosynthesis protein TsaB
MRIFATYLRIYFLIMSCILNIETSTDVCSVAISDSGQVIFNKEDHSGPNHAVKLGVYVDEALDFLDSHGLPLEAVAVSCGPGSYTGLRIGVSMAKGICYGRGVKLIAVPTLELMAVPVLLGEHPEEEDALIVPMLDARRMEVYAEVLDRALKVVRPIQADIVDADTYKEYLDQHHVYFFGNGAAKCMETINHPHAHLVEGIEPLAKNMAPLAEKRFAEGKFEDVAYFVPFYLKDFVAKMPKKLI